MYSGPEKICPSQSSYLAAWLVAPLLVLMAGCGVHLSRPDVTYNFHHPLLNERWMERLPAARASKAKGRTAKAKKAKAAGKAKSRKVAKTGSGSPAARPDPQELRGNDVEVVRREMVLSAQRLLGVRDSFSQDSFIRHILVVNNLDLGKLPEEGGVGWLYGKLGKEAGKVDGVAPGDVLFLGDGTPEQCVIVEKADADGTVTFIGYVAGSVQRGVLSLTHREVRRDEASQKVLNTFIGKTRLAGGLLLGAFSLQKHQERLASQGP
jgi:hypothetical protein